jgi:hypothetical protein
MATDQLTLPLTDEDLLTLAVHRHARADREEASTEDYLQLVDIFPAVLQRLEEKVEITRDLVCVEEIDLNDPTAWQRLITASAK